MSSIGPWFEQFISELCARRYLADFVIRAPKYSKSATQSLEAADLLIPWGSRLIVLQLRTRQVDSVEALSSSVELDRFHRRIQKAVRQIRTIKEALAAESAFTATNLRGARFAITAEYSQCVGVVLASIVDQHGNVLDSQLDAPARQETYDGVPIHVMLGSQFLRISSEYDTIPDLLNYLELRAQVLRSDVLVEPPREFDLLALCKADYPLMQRLIRGEPPLTRIAPGWWERLQKWKATEFADRNLRIDRSRQYDEVLETLHSCASTDSSVKDIDAPLSMHVDGERYFIIAQSLASASRVHRIAFAEKMGEKAERANYHPRGYTYCIMRPGDNAVPIVFLSSRQSSAQRRESLERAAAAACVKLGVRRVVGIATEHGNSQVRTFDFILFDNVDFENHEQLRELADEMFGPIRSETEDEWGNSS